MDVPEFQIQILLKNIAERIKNSANMDFIELPKKGEYSISFEADWKAITLTIDIDSTIKHNEIHLHSPKY